MSTLKYNEKKKNVRTKSREDCRESCISLCPVLFLIYLKLSLLIMCVCVCARACTCVRVCVGGGGWERAGGGWMGGRGVLDVVK